MKHLIRIAMFAVTTAVAAEIKPLMIGQPIPETMLIAADGKNFDLQAAAREQPLAIIFYRGGWCPYCNTHLGQLEQIEPSLRELGYRIIAISPDRLEKVSESIDKHNMTYTLLSDSSMAAAKAFGIAFEVPVATVLVVWTGLTTPEKIGKLMLGIKK